MKIFDTRIHGVLDYVMGATLILLPIILGWDNPERTLVMTLGWVTIGMSLLTAYEYSLFRVIPMGMHLFLDACSAIVLIGAPFAMSGIGQTPSYIMWTLGAAELIAVALSSTAPSNAFIGSMNGKGQMGTPHMP